MKVWTQCCDQFASEVPIRQETRFGSVCTRGCYQAGCEVRDQPEYRRGAQAKWPDHALPAQMVLANRLGNQTASNYQTNCDGGVCELPSSIQPLQVFLLRKFPSVYYNASGFALMEHPRARALADHIHIPKVVAKMKLTPLLHPSNS